MKKLMIAAAIVCAAVASQAATINWKTGGTIKPDGSNTAAAGTLNTFIWLVDAETYGKTSLDTIWKDYGSTKIADMSTGDNKADLNALDKGGSMTATIAQTVELAPAGTTDTYYGIIIGAYDGNKDGTVDMYIVNKNTATMNDSGTANGGQNLLKYIEGGSTPITWTAAAVPEPTSAMLLLLGMAGLALRRRRA